MKKIPFYANKVTTDKFFTVSDEDYDLVMSHNWSLYNTGTGLVIQSRLTNEDIKNGWKAGSVSVWRWIHNLKHGDLEIIDHKDGNRLNNTRENLRLCTHSENMRNKKTYKNNKSGFKGVRFDKKSGKYAVGIRFGRFDTPEEAHEAWKKIASFAYGEFVRFK